MSDLRGLHCNFIVRPRIGSEGFGSFIIKHRGGYVGERTYNSCVLVPLELELVLVGRVNCKWQVEEVQCAGVQLFGSISLEYNLVTSPMCSWMRFFTYRCNLPM
jgi:hypothetical protein